MRLIAIDWSGDRGGAHRKIWLAEAAAGNLVRLESGRDRQEIAEHLIAEAERTPGLVVGLDFAFSLPEWFLHERGLAGAKDLWALVDREGEQWLAACQPPFWGRPGRGRPHVPAEYRSTDRAVPATAGIRPKSVFQIGGAGAVGTGSLRGMPVLHRLNRAGFSVWPFDPPGRPQVVEIYPRVLTGPVNKSDPAGRAAYLAERYPQLGAGVLASAISSEDAFDAAVSALVMSGHERDLMTLPAVADHRSLLEGLIWHPAWRQDL